MGDESRWRDEDRFGLDEQERNRWNAWRDERDHLRYGREGRYGRESGGSYGGFRGEGSYAGYRGGTGEFSRDMPRGDYGQPGYGRDFGAPYRGYGYGHGYGGRAPYGQGAGQGRYEDRGWFERAADEVSSWFGDREAEQRRDMDAQQRGDLRGKGPKGYVRSDERIREDVCDRLCDDSMVDASEIDVAVSASEVTLSGTVESREQRRRAEDCAERVSGVKHVQNNLRVASTDVTTPGMTTTGTGARPGSTGTTGLGRNEPPPAGRAAH